MKRALESLHEEAERRKEIDPDTKEWLEHSLRMDALLDYYLKVTGR